MENANNTRIYHLKMYRELRIVTLEKPLKNEENEECIKIRIFPIQGNNNNDEDKNTQMCIAEIFGKELVIDKDYYFGYNEKFSIYTFTGCIVQIKGKTLQEYESKNSTIKEYLSLSYVLDAYRNLAKKKKNIGPRVLITGNNNSGKSSVSMLLLNYALKSGFKPIYIEADPKGNCDKMDINRGPGIMSCFIYDNNEGKKNDISLNTNNSNNRCRYALDYFFGYLDILDDINLYYHINECISSCTYLMLLNNLNYYSGNLKNNADQEIIYSSGFILNVPSEADIKIINNLIEIYNINIVVIIDNSFLHYSLKEYYNKDETEASLENCNNSDNIQKFVENVEKKEKEYNNVGLYKSTKNIRYNKEEEIKFERKNDDFQTNNNEYNSDNVNKIEIIEMPKYEGVIPSDNSRARYCRHLWFYDYFYKNINFNNAIYKKCHVITIKYNQTSFVRLDTKLAVPLSALPADWQNIKREIVHVTSYNGDIKNLMNCILGISYSKKINYVHLMNIAGFAHVQNVRKIETDNDNQKNEDKDYDNNIEEIDKNSSDQITNDFFIDIICPVSITTKNIPPYFIVPGNMKHIRF
ncbi:clp1-related protein, putative [Plasmodium berghei]|uniref:Polyribonucleotide 5'-hydroxyl-kinase Clp1, putative n=2 Tax=Plasmodium berghei TaxID=5821 RepID=A0A509AMN9_PLABA|nr:polyribonucleotide 5'-hydroxyl-kinase Clp1, putative [Plasmodium berghei ANKA]CXI24455.1 clp1-related protein, putative [Plasmodium berghei]SCM20293.1 clp1-related protein, putative [Plasmodium berghei]SCN23909.1 clp1-related protein, putative [Plasmodium berghei]SCO59298.1 clp1-related protein, putative [Plasmodium berghei]SCO60327.1 clp1-related protein, putative [Plasmodium berghei]|eukprot:XP_034420837.1 polyribonucleotide 5'-hydroxyl-kinase Clp1, putative [Plasmodium berghei ANKA]